MAKGHTQRRRTKKRVGGLGALSPAKFGGGLPALSPFSLTGGEGSTMPSPSAMPKASPMPPSDGKAGGQTHTKQMGGHKCGSRGGRKKSSKRRRRGGGLLATAAVPFGLFGLQRFFRGSRSTRKGVKRFSRSISKRF